MSADGFCLYLVRFVETNHIFVLQLRIIKIQSNRIRQIIGVVNHFVLFLIGNFFYSGHQLIIDQLSYFIIETRAATFRLFM